ncbi:hypothetical protein [Nocardioides houyundeii]|uniref:hypothetical protein n=1 Tax=Nocardioides houyundeii TaxID=2045452 RepID=UPI000C75CFB1|nr:hypothetical protein [Nocardioides houyundeii]
MSLPPAACLDRPTTTGRSRRTVVRGPEDVFVFPVDPPTGPPAVYRIHSPVGSASSSAGTQDRPTTKAHGVDPRAETPFLLGAAHGANTEPTSLESAAGGPLALRRTYFQSTEVDLAVATAAADLAKNRTPFVSFKLPTTWDRMAAGDGDAWARDAARRLAAIGEPGREVWVVLHHEPERDQPDIRQWTALQQRLAPMFDRPGIRFGICVTGWNQFHGEPEFSFESMYPFGAPIDFIALDVYQTYGELKNPTKWSDLSDYWRRMGAFAASVGVDWGLGEFGITDEGFADPRGRTFFTDTVTEMKAHGGSFAAYFDSHLNTGGSSLALSGLKLVAWAAAARGLREY